MERFYSLFGMKHAFEVRSRGLVMY